MNDGSVIQPILDALKYFSRSNDELQYYYKIIDKFCAKWFGHRIRVKDFDTVDILLIHELLGEYLRFDSNNQRIALWLLTINRICYNFTAVLSEALTEINTVTKNLGQSMDASLIKPIIRNLQIFEDLHLSSGINNLGENDTIGNFLQWVNMYSVYIYPSLENKKDFYDKTILRAMNFLLMEFIKQRTNDKRLAFLIMAIMEACKQYSLLQPDQQVPNITLNGGSDVIAGTEETIVEKILIKLKNENQKQRLRPAGTVSSILADKYIKESFDKFLEEMHKDSTEAVSIFNNYNSELAETLCSIDKGKQFIFLQTLFRYKYECREELDKNVFTNLKNSVNLLSSVTRDWFAAELKKLETRKDFYSEFVIQKLAAETGSALNKAKLFILLYLIFKFKLFS